ncbi:hypothetical protein [Geothrix sp. SG200]|uniref:hypothetical protein n=1 Tax=Geothrix sp. SG200 TaxID=2922865 RepID=UPI001FAE0076|nr:hypothetical protein [Geothrix sp. SG200]
MMMDAQPLTSIQVIDSAIKIGLGALIGGTISFFTQRYVQNQLMQKSKKEEYRKKIFEIVDILGKLHASIVNYLVVGSSTPIHKDMNRYSTAEANFDSRWKESMSIGFQLDILGLTNSSNCAHIFLLSLQSVPTAIEANISGDRSIEQSIHRNYDLLIASIKQDYQSLF